MKHYQLNDRITLELTAAHGRPGWFAGKTNRLALYSVRACGMELNLYVKRNWPHEHLPEDDFPGDDLISA